MGPHFVLLDYIVFVLYGIAIVSVGLYVSREKKGHKKNAEDYFLASKSLPWWAIGASLIASNISAEQFIGMSGSGYAIGLAIGSYEFMSAITLVIVGKFFLPVFLKKGIYTMPQFLVERYDSRVRTVMAVFWLLVYVFINLTSVLYLGALALNTIMGVPLLAGIIGLALFAAIYSIYGGLTAVAWTDVIQVIFLIGGGLLTTFLALNAVSDGQGAWAGLVELYDKVPEKFQLIIERGEMMVPDGQGGMKDAYMDIPGISVLIGGLWIANLSYWGFNQYIIQRGLAAKSIKEAQNGLVFAGFLKLLIPLIVVIPGIAAYVLTTESGTMLEPSDKAYPWLLRMIPDGLKGLAFAALAAAIVSSLASMLNSTSTIFTMDIYRNFIDKNVNENKQVTVGRITSVVALVIAAVIAIPLLGRLDQAFQFIQEFTGMITPGITVIFLAGLFWKRATANAALLVALMSFVLSILFKFVLPFVPFMNRMGYVAIILALIMVVVSVIERKTAHPNAVDVERSLFKTGTTFNVSTIIICVLTFLLYFFFW